MTLNPNQFALETVQGALDLAYNPNTISCKISASETATLVPGSPVKIEDSVGGVPNVLLATADTDAIFGFVVRNNKTSEFEDTDSVEIAIKNNVMQMTSGAAIARGAFVEADVSEAEVITAAGINPVAGFALDKASGADELIRVYIVTPENVPAGAFSSLGVTNNATIGGTLGVTGLITGTTLTLTGLLTGVTATLTGLLTGASATFSSTVGITGLLSAVAATLTGLLTGVNALFSGTVGITGLLSAVNVTLTGILKKSVTNYSAGAGALPITTDIIALTTGGIEALTLADGADGQELEIIMVVDGGDGTVTPANYANGSTLTFDGFDSAKLVFINSAWHNVGTPTATVA